MKRGLALIAAVAVALAASVAAGAKSNGTTITGAGSTFVQPLVAAWTPALGVSKWQTVLRVVLPTSFGGILTGTTLAIARAAGETAPLLFTCAIAGQLVDWNPTHSVQSIPLTIFLYSESADPSLHQQAWAAAFVLILFVLVTSLTARLLLERSRKKLGLQR